MTAVILPTQRLEPTQADIRRPSDPAWVRAVDAAMSGGIAAFALWTVLYEVALGRHWPVTPLTLVWLVAALPLAFLVGRASYREAVSTQAPTGSSDDTPPPAGDRDAAATAPEAGRHRGTRALVRLWPAGLLAVCAAVLLTFGSGWHFWVGWVLVVAALIWIAAALRRPADSPDGSDQRAPGDRGSRPAGRSPGLASLAVLLTGLAVSAGSLFVYRPSADDAYYVNLSTWVAARNHFPLRDTMFSDQAFPTSYGGGFPISSIEGLIGALARLVGVAAPTMAYLMLAPVFSFAAVWVLGQLARLWMPRHWLPVFAFSAVFVLVGTGSAYRAYSVNSIWQGKATAIAIVLPLIWIYATRLAASRRGHWILMLAVTGIAFIGLTSTAAILAPVIGGALLLAAVLLRNARIALGAVALVVAPLLGGAAVALLSQSVGGPHPKALTPWQVLHHAYGSTASAMVLLTLLAVLLAPLLLRERLPRALTWSAAAAAVLVLAPGVLALGNRLTGAGPVEWRLVIIPPVPTLVGILVVAAITWCLTMTRQHRTLRTATGAVTVAVALVILSLADGGMPWQVHLRVSPTPVWKTKPAALRNVRKLIATDPPHGQPILMPANAMIALSLDTVEWHGVAPRPLYVASLQEPARLKTARMILVRLAASKHTDPSPRRVKRALHQLDVGTVCLKPGDGGAEASVRAAGFGPFSKVGSLVCAFRPRVGR